jgi:hypothetical protein
MRDKLGWIQQVDGQMCGPLGLAAAVLLLQGVRPTFAALGLTSPSLTSQNMASIRRSLLVMVTYSIKKGKEPEGERSRQAISIAEAESQSEKVLANVK